MNYSNPNFYYNYPQYNNGLGNSTTGQYIQTPSYPSQMQVQQSSTINGKLVENLEMVKIAEVPIGSYAVFPKADLSEIYVKSWNNNGTTNVGIYKPIEQENKEDEIKNRLNVLENKIDLLLQKDVIDNTIQKGDLF